MKKDPKSETIKIRMTKSEYECLKKVSESLGVTKSEFVRYSIDKVKTNFDWAVEKMPQN